MLIRMYASMVASPLWTDRTDDRAAAFAYGKVPMVTPDEIAETMMRMIEEGKYSGGTVLVKSESTEEVVFDLKMEKGAQVADVVPPDGSHVKAVMDSERGKPWKA